MWNVDLGKVAMVLNQLAIVVCNCNILKWALVLLIGFHPILLSFLGGGGADNNKTFLQSLEGFKVHVSELGHSPCLSVFGKKHPFGSETFAVATLNLHGVSLPDVYQNTDFCWQTQLNWTKLNWTELLHRKNTTVLGWHKIQCLVSKTKDRKHQGKLKISSPPFREWQMSAYDRGSDVGLTFFAMCSAPCLPHVLHSFQRLFCEVFAPNPSFASYNPFEVALLKLKTSCWRKGCCFDKWMTHFTFPAVTWSLRDKNPKDSRHQNNTENNRLWVLWRRGPKKKPGTQATASC